MAKTRADAKESRRTGVVHRVLFVDDDVNVLSAVRRSFADCRFKLVVATSGDGGLKALQSDDTFAVIVSDMKMPGMDGIQFLRKSIGLCPNAVRIMLTGCDDQATAVDAINTGEVLQFLTKPCPNEDLLSAIERAIEVYEDLERIRIRTRALNETALLDDLTGVFNHRSLFQLAKDEFDRSVRFHRPFGIALIRIDDIEKAGGTPDGEAEETVLRQTAAVLNASVRDRDILGRFDDDEFMVALLEVTPDQALAIAGRLREKVEEATLNTSFGPLGYSVSIGVALRGSGDMEFQDLVKRADQALSRARELGPNGVQIDRPAD